VKFIYFLKVHLTVHRIMNPASSLVTDKITVTPAPVEKKTTLFLSVKELQEVLEKSVKETEGKKKVSLWSKHQWRVYYCQFSVTAWAVWSHRHYRYRHNNKLSEFTVSDWKMFYSDFSINDYLDQMVDLD
jgi:hypothetical protein